jgi:hypothetical protein
LKPEKKSIPGHALRPAPPVYRPPAVTQPKQVASSIPQRTGSVAPPVYRPLALAATQPKQATGAVSQRTGSAAPPVYRPLRDITAQTMQNGDAAKGRKSIFPPMYHPHQTAVLPAKKNHNAVVSSIAQGKPPTYRPQDRAVSQRKQHLTKAGMRPSLVPTAPMGHFTSRGAGQTIQRASKLLTIGFDVKLQPNGKVDYMDSTLDPDHKPGHIESIANLAHAKNLTPQRVEYCDLSDVGAMDTITLTGHGSNSAMTYSAEALADLLATRGLRNKKIAHIEVLGCRAGQDFRETLLNRLQFKHAVSTGSSAGSRNVVFMVGGVPTTLSNSAQQQYDLASVFGETAYQRSILQDYGNHVPLGSGPEWKSGASPLIDL